jgi:hypothetical protein
MSTQQDLAVKISRSPGTSTFALNSDDCCLGSRVLEATLTFVPNGVGASEKSEISHS